MEAGRPEGAKLINSFSSFPPIHSQAQFPRVAEQVKLVSDCLSLPMAYYEVVTSMVILCYLPFSHLPSFSLTLTTLGLYLPYKVNHLIHASGSAFEE